jgi:hypothetical protein
MVKGQLPGEGPVRIGPVRLPAGRLTGGHGSDGRAAWVTMDPVPDSGQVWAALAELHPRTGLVPIQLDGLLGGLPHDGLRDDALRSTWVSPICGCWWSARPADWTRPSASPPNRLSWPTTA